MRRTLVTTCRLFAIALVAPGAVARAQDAAQVQEGRGGLRRAEVFGLPLHRRQGQQDESARRRRHEAVGRRHPRSGSPIPTEMTAKTKSTKKPPMPDRYGKLPAADLDALVAYMQSLK